MIGLLIDAAIAVVTVLDRACSAVENVRVRATPPQPVDAHTSPGAVPAATGSGGHPDPLRWGPEDAEYFKVSLIEALATERDEARAALAEASAIGKWLISEADQEYRALNRRLASALRERDDYRALSQRHF